MAEDDAAGRGVQGLRVPHPVVVVARVVGLVLAIPVTVGVAMGWLYWLRALVASWPGPTVNDALPLDELPGHAAIPLLAFIPVLAVVGAVLGLLARAFDFNRISAALVLTLAVGVWLFVFDAISLYIVRQVPFGQAAHQALALEPIYLGAGLTGVAGGLLGRRSVGPLTWNRPLAFIVALAGLADLLSTIGAPTASDIGFVREVAPIISPTVGNALIVPVAVLLLASARGLSRRRRSAYLLALFLFGASAVLHFLKDETYGSAVISALIGLLLFARRQDFTSPPGPRSRVRALERLVTMVGAALLFGTTALVVNMTIADLTFNPLRAVADTARALVGVAPGTSRFLPASFTVWFPWAVRSIVAAGVLWAAEAWLAPWRPTTAADDRSWERAGRIVHRWGIDTLAPFALRRDKMLFTFAGGAPSQEDADAVVIAYRVVQGVALMSGDPIGPPELIPDALGAFVAFVHLHGWRLAVLGASERLLDVFQARGLHALHHGDEAVIDVTTFSLEGGPRRAVRQAVHRLERRGYTSEIVFAGDASAALGEELSRIDRVWLKGHPRKGFSMELDDLFRLGGTDAMFVVGRAPDGQVAGFLHLALCPAGRALSLSSMPRLQTTPNGFNSWLIVEAVRWSSEHGYDKVSLNFSPFASLLTAEAGRSLVGRVQRDVLLSLKAALSLQLDNLQRFNRQFGPSSQPRFIVYEHRTDLPLIALAAMAAEGYLPFSDYVLGRRLRRRPSGGPTPSGVAHLPAAPDAAAPAAATAPAAPGAATTEAAEEPGAAPEDQLLSG